MAPDDVLEHVGGRLVLLEHARDRLDRRGLDRVPALDERGELPHDRRARLDGIGLAVEGEHVSAQEDVALEVPLERAQDLVVGPASSAATSLDSSICRRAI